MCMYFFMHIRGGKNNGIYMKKKNVSYEREKKSVYDVTENITSVKLIFSIIKW